MIGAQSDNNVKNSVRLRPDAKHIIHLSLPVRGRHIKHTTAVSVV